MTRERHLSMAMMYVIDNAHVNVNFSDVILIERASAMEAWFGEWTNTMKPKPGFWGDLEYDIIVLLRTLKGLKRRARTKSKPCVHTRSPSSAPLPRAFRSP